MDRNSDKDADWVRVYVVALRKESVDRNFINVACAADRILSLSARRAWIEIRCACCSVRLLAVALRKESVDRNIDMLFKLVHGVAGSLSARRAWIEIGCTLR